MVKSLCMLTKNAHLIRNTPAFHRGFELLSSPVMIQSQPAILPLYTIAITIEML